MTVVINFTCKYARLATVLRHASKSLIELIDSCPIVGDRKYITVDVKKQDLKIGQYTCIPGYHRDSIADPSPLHHIIVFGHNRTEFKEYGKIPEGKWFTYGLDYHRGPKVVVDETRILVRVTESNVIKGNSKISKL